MLKPVFRIRDIFVWIRIQIRIFGSVHWIMDPAPDPFIFGTGFQDAKNISFFKVFFGLFIAIGSSCINISLQR
jgi:hypothetical protein